MMEVVLLVLALLLPPGPAPHATSPPSTQEEQGAGGLVARLRKMEQELGPDHIDLAGPLNQLATQMVRRGRQQEARPLFERALDLRIRHLGPEDATVAVSLSGLGLLEKSLNHLEEAQQYMEQALAIRETALGRDDPLVARSLINLATILRQRREFDRSQELLQRALVIAEAALGPEHHEIAAILNNLGLIHQRNGEFLQAIDLFQRALKLKEDHYGIDHPETVLTLNNLATILLVLDRTKEAEPLLERSLRIREMEFGEESSMVAATLNVMGGMFVARREDARAQKYYERSLAIREKLFGSDHRRLVPPLTGLATALRNQGDYERARPLYERALAIREKELGPDHPDVAKSLNHLATMLRGLGDFDAARPLYDRVLEIQEKELGPTHPTLATSLTNLATMLSRDGQHAIAAPYLQRALAIQKERFGASHPNVANTLISLANMHRSLDELVEAQRLAEQAVAMREMILRKGHPAIAEGLVVLASVLIDRGELEQAEGKLEQAMAIRASAAGADPTADVGNTNEMAQLYASLGMTEEAARASHQAARRRLDFLTRNGRSLTEAERFRFIRFSLSLIGRVEHFTPAHLPAELQRDAYDLVLDYKGLAGRLAIASRESLALDVDPERRQGLVNLQNLDRRLSQLATNPEANRREISQVQRDRDRAERELQRGLPPVAPPAATFEQIRDLLQPGEAVIDFFQIGTKEGNLVAWLTLPEQEEPLRFVFGRSSRIEGLVEDFLDTLVSDRGGRPLEAAGDSDASAAESLYRRLWEPMAADLDGVERIFLSPDSFLAALPFECLQRPNGRFLIENNSFVYVADLSHFPQLAADHVASSEPSLLAMGGVNFRQRASGSDGPANPADGSATPADGPGGSTGVAQERGSFDGYWPPLRWTAGEAETVMALHQEVFADDAERLILTGKQPTEEVLKAALPQHTILHLATHGFFAAEGFPSMWEEAQKEDGGFEMVLDEDNRELIGRLPGFLSGLVCAGASDLTADHRDDGYLTAEEVLWLDLSKADLVVLSACQTALGRAQAGEGMLGLRRAFHQAGARSVISSLWSVNDRSTAQLMQDFYTGIWTQDLPPAEALRKAQLAMLKRNRIENRGEGLPVTWGAFVLSGSWR